MKISYFIYVTAFLLCLQGINTNVLERVITFKNLCEEPVWFGSVSGTCPRKGSKTDVLCGGDGDCLEGSKCIQTGPIKMCFWNSPVPDNGDFKLDHL